METVPWQNDDAFCDIIFLDRDISRTDINYSAVTLSHLPELLALTFQNLNSFHLRLNNSRKLNEPPSLTYHSTNDTNLGHSLFSHLTGSNNPPASVPSRTVDNNNDNVHDKYENY